MSSHVAKADREKVMADYNNCCAACGMPDPDFLDVDHVRPTSFYLFRKIPVDNSPRNLQVLCRACNNVKNNIEGLAKLAPRLPEWSVKVCQAERAIWKEIVKNARKANSLWD